MPLSAVFNRKNQGFGFEPGNTAASGDAVLVQTNNVSPAAGVVPSALTGDFRAGGYKTASVLGTGQNVDLVTYGAEAV